MKTLTIKKSIGINASKEYVWNILIEDKFIRIWYACFSPGTYAQTDWTVGSKAIFTDTSQSGMIAKITANKPGELLSMEYTGIVNAGAEDYESDMAQAIKGGQEIYTLTETNGLTQLAISCDMGEDYYEMMAAQWDKALEKIKELAESNAA